MTFGAFIGRLCLSAVVVAAWAGIISLTSPAASLVLGDAAVQQLNPSNMDYLQMSYTTAIFRGMNWWISAFGILLLLACWWGPLARIWSKMAVELSILMVCVFCTLASDGAYAYYDKQDWAEWRVILPNQSAFLIPQVGNNRDNQGQFGSAEYLERNKVAAKRVQIPHVKLENSGAWSNFFIPSATLIIVDRTPFYREWSNNKAKGTSSKMEGMACESAESLNLMTSIGISATVQEADAAKFLYWFGVRPLKGNLEDPQIIFSSTMEGVSLAEVMDTVVRGKVHADLCDSLGKRKLNDAFGAKSEIIQEVTTSVKAMFAPMGITIGFIGFADPFDYDESIQRAINGVYIAEKRAAAAETLAPALPVLQQEADIRVKEGIAKGVETKGLPNLPSFMVIPSNWIEALGSFFTTKSPAQ